MAETVLLVFLELGPVLGACFLRLPQLPWLGLQKEPRQLLGLLLSHEYTVLCQLKPGGQPHADANQPNLTKNTDIVAALFQLLFGVHLFKVPRTRSMLNKAHVER